MQYMRLLMSDFVLSVLKSGSNMSVRKFAGTFIVFVTVVASTYSNAAGEDSRTIRVGFYSAINWNGSREEQLRRMSELKGLGVNTIIEGEHPLDEQFVNDLHSYGIKWAAKVTHESDWYGERGKGDFNSAKAEEKLRKASQLTKNLDYLYLAHEVQEFATHEERVVMYKLVKRYFPRTPVIMYYSAAIDRMEQSLAKTNYRYGTGETDIALISIAVHEGSNKDSKVDVAESVSRLKRVSRIIKDRSPSVRIWILTSFARDNSMRTIKKSMWSSDVIASYGSALIKSGQLDGFFFRSYGRFYYDLGYPEWTKQREVVSELFRSSK
jgi:hypothetical protein